MFRSPAQNELGLPFEEAGGQGDGSGCTPLFGLGFFWKQHCNGFLNCLRQSASVEGVVEFCQECMLPVPVLVHSSSQRLERHSASPPLP